ncbi:radical SAM protein [bacterium]|nr:radical SAM protein [bacterium]
MRLLFIHPPGNLELEYGELHESGALYPALGLACIAAIGLEEGHEVRVIDAEASQLNAQMVMAQVEAYKPDLVGFQAFCTTQGRVSELAAGVKALSSEIITVIGGVQVTLFKDSFMADPVYDYGVYGEGEEVFRHLLRALPDRKGLGDVAGLIWRQDGRCVINPPQALIKDLDRLPMPALHLFPLEAYHSSAQLRGRKTLHIMTSRGCPYRCVYCSSNLIFGKTHRYYSTGRVIREIHHMIDDFGADGIQFYDEVFTMNRKRVMALCQALIDDGCPVPWTCFTRVNLVDQELLEKMAAAGCYQIFYGLESGVQRLLDLVHKDITLEQARQALGETRRAGIESVASFMLTIPTETVEETEQTIRFGIEVDPDYVYWLTTTPYPGTGLHDLAKKDGQILVDDFTRYNVFNEIVYLPAGRSIEEIKSTLKKAYRRFYLRPRYIIRRLKGLHKLPPWKLWNLIKSGIRMFY